jgi:hypothetical protein
MALLSVIRRWHFREGMSIRESSGDTILIRFGEARKLLQNRIYPATVPKHC